jgi:glycine/D-amino acid oxidase-like deaminating enzyme
MLHPDLDNLDVLVVGAGLFGQIIGRHLQRQGRTVTILDAEKERSGSKPAACLMRNSWLTKMTKQQQAESFSVLDSCYGIHEIDAYISAPGPIRSLGKRTTVHWVAPASIFKANSYRAVTVVDVRGGSPKSLFKLDIEEPWRTAKLIIVAAGVWSNGFPSLPTVKDLTAQAGVAFLYPCDEHRESRASIQPWAPYKQLVMLPNLWPGKLWVGDGTALKESSLTEKRIRESRARCDRFARWDDHHTPEEQAQMREEGQKAAKMYGGEWVEEHPMEDLGQPDPVEQIIGLRPYVARLNQPCWLQLARPRVWVATGGAKNGTAAAGWAAYKIAEATN